MLRKTRIILNVFGTEGFHMQDLKQKFVKTLMYKFCSPKAFKWLRRKKKKSFIMKACAEFYFRQIAEKFSLKLPLCITKPERLIQTSLSFSLVRLRVPSAFVQPTNSTPSRLN